MGFSPQSYYFWARAGVSFMWFHPLTHKIPLSFLLQHSWPHEKKAGFLGFFFFFWRITASQIRPFINRVHYVCIEQVLTESWGHEGHWVHTVSSFLCSFPYILAISCLQLASLTAFPPFFLIESWSVRDIFTVSLVHTCTHLSYFSLST